MGFKLKLSDKKSTNKEIDPLELLLEENPNLDLKVDTSLIKEKELNPWEYIRVVNVRGDPEYQATKDERVIIGHRGNPILGNKNPKEANTMAERDRVIEESKKDLEADLAVQGPIWHALHEIATDIVENKQKVAIACWCAPTRCHTEAYLPVVVDMAKKLLKEKLDDSLIINDEISEKKLKL